MLTLILNSGVEAYKLEMVLMLYAIVIGFSFKIFQDFPVLSFQSIAGVATILFLSSRLLSLKAKFGDLEQFSYIEIYFFVDIVIMLSFYRFLSILRSVSQMQDDPKSETHYCWLWLAFMMGLTIVYRAFYKGIKLATLFQFLVVAYIIGGYFLSLWMRSQNMSAESQEKKLFIFSVPLLLAAVGYCIIRFRFPSY